MDSRRTYWPLRFPCPVQATTQKATITERGWTTTLPQRTAPLHNSASKDATPSSVDWSSTNLSLRSISGMRHPILATSRCQNMGAIRSGSTAGLGTRILKSTSLGLDKTQKARKDESCACGVMRTSLGPFPRMMSYADLCQFGVRQRRRLTDSWKGGKNSRSRTTVPLVVFAQSSNRHSLLHCEHRRSLSQFLRSYILFLDANAE